VIDASPFTEQWGSGPPPPSCTATFENLDDQTVVDAAVCEVPT